MTFQEIGRYRLHSQHITGMPFKAAKDIVSWMGAMQAQDYNHAKWAVGLRLPGATDKTIEKAIAKGDIIRTHLLRPTWHLVSAKDIYWMLELTAPHIKASLKSRHKELELTSTVFKKSNKVIEKALTGGKQLTREELVSVLQKGKLNTGDQRAAHMLLVAELDQIICSGATREKKTTYGLLAECVRQTKKLNRDEALALLAKKYFTSHGPATLQDFTWWSGLPAADARKALEMVKGDFTSERIDVQTYWFDPSTSPVNNESVYLLPAFDEFIISYKDRSACLAFPDHKKTISNNGIFRPVIVIGGQAIGIWKRTTGKHKTLIETEFFSGKNPGKAKSMRKMIDAASQKVVAFFDRDLGI